MITTRTKIVSTALGAATLSVLITTPLLAGPASASRGREFTVHALHVSDASIDAGRHGFSAGDADLFDDRLTMHGKRVGWDAGSCTTIRVGRHSADQFCEIALHFGRSQIVAAGAVRAGAKGPGTFALAIGGGTGRYEGVRGEVLIAATNGSSVPITVALTG